MDGESLSGLRGEIDRIDAAMHDLLMERASVIERLVAAKRPGATSFRPDREAAILRRLAERHRGGLPFDAVEAIWRVLMTAFVHAQSPFTVHGHDGEDGLALRDSVRFHFGFAAPYRSLGRPRDVVAALAATPRDLGVVGLQLAATEPWWRAMEEAGAPKAIARLPFIPRRGHPAPEPVLVIAGAASEPAGAVAVLSGRPQSEGAAGFGDLEVLSSADGFVLAALRSDAPPDTLERAFAEPPVRVGDYPASAELRP